MFTLILARYLAMGWSVTDAGLDNLSMAHYGSFPGDDTYWTLLILDNGDGTLTVESERKRQQYGPFSPIAIDHRTVDYKTPHSALMAVRRSMGAVR